MSGRESPAARAHGYLYASAEWEMPDSPNIPGVRAEKKDVLGCFRDPMAALAVRFIEGAYVSVMEVRSGVEAAAVK